MKTARRRDVGRIRWQWVVVPAALFVAGCGEPTQPTGPAEVTVMTRNVYVGTELATVLDVASLSELPRAAATVWANVQATAFPERAGALAAEIVVREPHLVGLQEVALFRMQTPGDFFIGNLRDAADTVLDYLALILDSLEARGVSYAAVGQFTGVDAEGPMLLSGRLVDLRVTNRDVILARADVGIAAVRAEQYVTNQTFTVAGVAAPFPRGWVSVEATVSGRTLRFMSTHLEPRDTGPDTQVAQGDEVLAVLRDVSGPVALVGDFNSQADGGGTPTYGNLIAGGLTDVWSRVRPGESGFTCCHDQDLLNPIPHLSSRIDLILVRGDIEMLGVLRVGLDPADRTASELWPSDHVGVAATLRIP